MKDTCINNLQHYQASRHTKLHLTSYHITSPHITLRHITPHSTTQQHYIYHTKYHTTNFQLCYHCFLPCAECTSVTLPSLPDPISCVIEDTCLGFQCCVDVNLIITTVSQSVYLNIDLCNFVISIGFGAWYVDASLLTYYLNTERTYTLGNAIDVRYDIHCVKICSIFLYMFNFCYVILLYVYLILLL